MRGLRRFFSLRRDQQFVLLQAALVLAITRIGLWIVPMEVTHRTVVRVAAWMAPNTIANLVWAVNAAACYIPRASCLTRALALQALLRSAGYRARLEIGVRKDAERHFEAHAWVSCGNEIVIGGPDTSQFAPLVVWEV